MKKQTRSRIILLLVVVVGIAAVVGVVLYVKNMNEVGQKRMDELALEASALSKKQSEQQTPAEVTPTTYLAIKEWGVKLPLSDDITDLTYTNLGDQIALNTATFVTLSGKKCSGGDVGYMGSIRRAKSLDSLYSNPAIRTQNEAVQVGEYYYLYGNPTQMYCQQEPANQRQVDYFTETIPQIEEASKLIISQ